MLTARPTNGGIGAGSRALGGALSTRQRNRPTGPRSAAPGAARPDSDDPRIKLARYATGRQKLVPASEVAAIVVEPIQGEGGYVIPEDGFLQGLRAICDQHGILLVADEVQSGAGRTGKMWAVDHWGVKPDILLTAKGIASGLPLGAMVARAELMERWGPGAHGSTYGGNRVACAAALATIELLEGGLVENARIRGEQALAGLQDLPRVTRDSSARCAERA